METLDSILLANPAIKAEYDNKIKEARDSGIKSVMVAIKPLGEIIASDEYRKSNVVMSQIGKSLSGEISFETARQAVTLYDIQKEQKLSNAAKEETDSLPDVPGDLSSESQLSESGINTQADLDLYNKIKAEVQ